MFGYKKLSLNRKIMMIAVAAIVPMICLVCYLLWTISYTTGVPAMIGAALVVDKVWDKDGVFNIEEFDPDPFMDMLNQYGLPWIVDENPKTVE